MEIRRDEVLDGIESVKRKLDSHDLKVKLGVADESSVPEGLAVVNTSFIDLLFAGETPEESKERIARLERRLANGKTRKTYKNGVLQNTSQSPSPLKE